MTTETIDIESRATEWVESYLRAWASNDPEDIAALFTETAEYHETPFETVWIGRERIIAGWRSRWQWQAGGWTFDWNFASVAANEVIVTGVGHYTELGDFDNVWSVAFDDDGLCTKFCMTNTEQVR